MNLLYHCSLCGAKIIVNKESPTLIQCPNCGYYYMRTHMSSERTWCFKRAQNVTDYENLREAFSQFFKDGFDSPEDEKAFIELYTKTYQERFSGMSEDVIPDEDRRVYEMMQSKYEAMMESPVFKQTDYNITTYHNRRVPLSERIKRFFKQKILRFRYRKQIKKTKATDGIDKVIFLDFDGVLDNYYYCYQLRKQGLPERDNYGMIFDTNCVECLKYILDKTDAHIVITSSWKDFMAYEELLKMWHERILPGTIFDAAPSMIGKRGEEIDQWLKEFKRPCSYVILDDLDDSFFNPHQLEHFIQINPNRGIQMEDARKAVEILNEQI